MFTCFGFIRTYLYQDFEKNGDETQEEDLEGSDLNGVANGSGIYITQLNPNNLGAHWSIKVENCPLSRAEQIRHSQPPMKVLV
ncbi:hypothetical protein SDJN02_10898, partial [Cucurbita argyrosperma subsp. argyrosperma]